MFGNVLPALLEELKRRHSEAARQYHDWSHIEALARHLQSIRDRVHDSDAVLYAILFHDAVYDPRAKDNERQSAALLRDAIVQISQRSRGAAVKMIEATEGHYLPEQLRNEAREDCAHFLDMDLAILGASDRRFDIYEEQIRREYAHVPENAFREGRAKVLRHFAERERLYFSDWGYGRFEEKARANIARSLTALSS